MAATEELKDLMCELCHGSQRPTRGAYQDYRGRELIVTKYDGAYGTAGWVIALNGSPPRGVLIASPENYVPDIAVFVNFNSSRRCRSLGEKQSRLVRDVLSALGYTRQ